MSIDLDFYVKAKELLEFVQRKPKDQINMTEHLRKMDYAFIPHEQFIEMAKAEYQNIDTAVYDEQWAFMARRYELGETYDQDKYDLRYVFAFKLHGEHVNEVGVLLKCKHHEFFEMEYPAGHKVNFKKVKVHLAFPEFMSHPERKLWRTEYFRRRDVDPKTPITTWFRRFEPFVIVGEPDKGK